MTVRDLGRVDHNELLACPRCGGDIQRASDAVTCTKCGFAGQQEAGIVDLSTQDLYWSYIPRSDLQRMVTTAEQSGLEAAFQRTFESVPQPDFYRRIMDESRGDFRFLLPISRQATVLDLGSGWGATTLALARQFARVIAADGTRENLQWVACRAREAGLGNVEFVRIDPLEGARLPFRDASLDAVILSGVLEWIGTGSAQGSPPELQSQLLKEVRRILRPEGCVYVAIENRFYVLYWLGMPEPHTRIPFVSVLPRWAANLMSRLLRGKPFRNYTPSFGSLRSLVRNAGFDRPEFYLPLPSYQHPEVIVPLEDGRCLRYWIRHVLVPRRFLHRVYAAGLWLLSSLGILKYVVSDFALVARRSHD